LLRTPDLWVSTAQIWLRASFNRWTHAAPLAPIKMGHVANCPHLCATIEVPTDAHMVRLHQQPHLLCAEGSVHQEPHLVCRGHCNTQCLESS
jgi:hypothetical protein